MLTEGESAPGEVDGCHPPSTEAVIGIAVGLEAHDDSRRRPKPSSPGGNDLSVALNGNRVGRDLQLHSPVNAEAVVEVSIPPVAEERFAKEDDPAVSLEGETYQVPDTGVRHLACGAEACI